LSLGKISVTGLTRKALLVGMVLLFAVLTFFTAKWVLGDAIASRTEFTEATEFAVSLAPDDSQTRYAYSLLLSQTFDPVDNAASLKQLEAATALSPHNFLLWLDLGKSLERNGEPDRAIAAFRRAKDLAPSYSITKWTLGNALLRQGDHDEAVPLIIAAAETQANYAGTAASLVWQILGGDLASTKVALKDAPITKSRLIPILAGEKAFNEAVEIWNGLNSAEKKTNFAEVGRTLYGQLVEAKRFRQALDTVADISSDQLGNLTPGNVFDGGFESRIPNENKTVFEWRYPADQKMGLTEGSKRSGNYSFLIGFPTGTTSIKSLAQTIAVEPGATHNFSIYFRSDLKTNGSIKWEIVNAADGKRLAVTDSLVASGEWTGLRASFTTDSDGIEIRLIKECAAGECPVEGNIWFDDARLEQTDP
jgi:tetratricopeptide (TPR) repeat protein